MDSKTKTNPIIIFDGLCYLCEASVLFIINRDKQGKFHFAQAQSDVGSLLLKEHAINQYDLDTFVLIKNNIPFIKSTAALEIARELDGYWNLFYIFKVVPRFVRDSVYTYIAKKGVSRKMG